MTYQASKKTDFTVDLIWWGSLRLAPIISYLLLIIKSLEIVILFKTPINCLVIVFTRYVIEPAVNPIRHRYFSSVFIPITGN